ncbi:hypothetical protein evm_013301 [Chilo suppressalis]|nr:hypothetical protein evm_013301 [Chilo suppressalis]
MHRRWQLKFIIKLADSANFVPPKSFGAHLVHWFASNIIIRIIDIYIVEFVRVKPSVATQPPNWTDAYRQQNKMADQIQGLLEPGKIIRPIIDHEGVKLLVERLYGISVLELSELNGYDDKNYKIVEDPNVKNPLITNHSPHGYVLKIMNSMDSLNVSVVEAQNEIMNFLNARSVTCPKPVRNVYGHLHSVETIGGKQHAVRLLEYVPGELLKNVPLGEPLLYQLGEFVAYLDNKLQNFNHSGLVSRQHIWMLTTVPHLEKFKYVIKDAEKLDLAEEVLEEFKYAIVPRLEELERGVIHGDVNEMNILVSPKPGCRH